MTTSPVTEFLAARYDEAEQLARDAAAEQHPSGFPMGTAVEYGLERAGVSEKFRLFATMWEPRDVLADLSAKRALLKLWQDTQDATVSPDTHHLADQILDQLCAPYGKRAVCTYDHRAKTTSWHLEDVEVSADV